MTNSPPVFRVGTRNSKLALIQSDAALRRFAGLWPDARFIVTPCSSPGDRDQTADLRASPPDFFTRDLDDALRAQKIDLAVHSAKDLPEPMPADIDWCWLPGREDPRDVLVLPPGRTLADLPPAPRIGVSSDRRAAWCRRRFPAGVCLPVRGVIEARLQQLDAGRFDLLVMAAAALIRLNLARRITAWIPLAELEAPAGQGALAITFRLGDCRLQALRNLLVKPVVIAGAGVGRASAATLETAAALESAEVCLHDALMDQTLLDRLPCHALRIDVGKRCGTHRADQPEINRLLTLYSRRGARVVRLKGGDPGIFGRLAEEAAALGALRLPARVLPGISSLQAATTGTGMLLTRRGAARGFTVMTPRMEGGGVGAVDAAARRDLPLVFFMGVSVLPKIVAQLMAESRPLDTPAAVVFDAGAPNETIIRGRLDEIAGRLPDADRPGLIIIGAPAADAWPDIAGPLQGRRVLLTCSAALQPAAVQAVLDFGGRPISLPLIATRLDPAALPALAAIHEFQWVAVSSPATAQMLLPALQTAGMDLRRLPQILAAGPGTAAVLQKYGIIPEAVPDADFGTAGMVAAARQAIPAGARILRLRSQLAGGELTRSLNNAGFQAQDCVLYTNTLLQPEIVPDFDAVFFASASAVAAWLAIRPAEALRGKIVMAIGQPTRAALAKHGIAAARQSPEATTHSAIETLAGMLAWERLAAYADSPGGAGSLH